MPIFLAAPLDQGGNVSLILQVIILFLLILGLPLVREVNSKKNLLRHGYLTAVAMVLHTALVFAIMVPSFSDGISELGSLSIINNLNVLSHAVLGTLAEVLGVVLVVYWVGSKPSNMRCARLGKLMLPTIIIWGVSVANGALIHVFGML
jgi:hypothetical protein